MRYLMLYRPDAPEDIPPTEEQYATMGEFIGEISKAGVLLAAEGCQPSAMGARVRQTGGKVTVTDGPFTEAKEVIGGFALVQVKSLDEAKEWAKRFLKAAGDGESEIRLLHEAPAFES